MKFSSINFIGIAFLRGNIAIDNYGSLMWGWDEGKIGNFTNYSYKLSVPDYNALKLVLLLYAFIQLFSQMRSSSSSVIHMVASQLGNGLIDPFITMMRWLYTTCRTSFCPYTHFVFGKLIGLQFFLCSNDLLVLWSRLESVNFPFIQ